MYTHVHVNVHVYEKVPLYMQVMQSQVCHYDHTIVLLQVKLTELHTSLYIGAIVNQCVCNISALQVYRYVGSVQYINCGIMYFTMCKLGVRNCISVPSLQRANTYIYEQLLTCMYVRILYAFILYLQYYEIAVRYDRFFQLETQYIARVMVGLYCNE